MAPPWRIDRDNILRASLWALARAVKALPEIPRLVFVDGRDRIDAGCDCQAVIGGDGLVASIAAASIVAKVTRDRLMACLGAAHPGYGFERHMGYSVPEHFSALDRLGPTVHHRRSFSPVADRLGALIADADEAVAAYCLSSEAGPIRTAAPVRRAARRQCFYVPLYIEFLRSRPLLVFWWRALRKRRSGLRCRRCSTRRRPAICRNCWPSATNSSFAATRSAVGLLACRNRFPHRRLFGVYLLSQLCVVATYWCVFALGRAIVGPPHAVIAVLLMVGISAVHRADAGFRPAHSGDGAVGAGAAVLLAGRDAGRRAGPGTRSALRRRFCF